ncbi:MAG TPA: glycosyltransferase family A protein [Anaeromyxobacteraceae bacterium]|nr:glycosyltransferase family A protein [Anaeromyxobacteraceae bacterium]
MNDLVSIVIPNHDLGSFVGEAIDSALAQTHRELEIVVVDDGSGDDSVARIRAHPGLATGAFRLLEQANAGVCGARNAGAAVCRGAYLLFLDADDVLDRRYVEACLGALRASPLPTAYAYTAMQHFGASQELDPSRPFDPAWLLTHNFVNASALIRREAFQAVGGWNPDFRTGHEDHELWIRMLDRGYVGVLVPEPLLRYRRHPGGSRNSLSVWKRRRLLADVAVRHPRMYRSWLRWHPLRAAAARRRRQRLHPGHGASP